MICLCELVLHFKRQMNPIIFDVMPSAALDKGADTLALGVVCVSWTVGYVDF